MGVMNLSCGLYYVYYELVAMHGCCGFAMWVVLCVLCVGSHAWVLWICHVGWTMCIMSG